MSALFEAVRNGDLETFERLVANGASLVPEGTRSPLHEALRLGRASMAKRLVTAGADVNAKVGDGYSPLRIAIAALDLGMAEYLIANGADVNTATRFGETPLHAVHDARIASILLSHGADVNAKALDGGTPLHYAAWWDRKDVARLLVENGADVNAETIYGETPLWVARRSSFRELPSEGCESVESMLVGRGAAERQGTVESPSGLDPRILRPYLHIHDGLVPSALSDEAWQRLNQPIWGFGLGTYGESPYKNARTSIPLGDSLVREMSRIIEPHLPYACRLISCYANANRTGDADQVHKDCDEPGYPTAIYYANTRWDSEWAGETVLFNEAKDEFVRCVYPRPGRIVIFDGRIWHNARVPTRHFGGIRITVVFNYEHTGF